MKPTDAGALLLDFLHGLEAHGVSTVGLVQVSAGDLRQAIANAEALVVLSALVRPDPPKPDKPELPNKPQPPFNPGKP